MIDAKARGDKAAVAKHQKEIEHLKALMANAPTKQYKQSPFLQDSNVLGAQRRGRQSPAEAERKIDQQCN